MRGAPSGGVDLSKLSTEELLKMKAAPTTPSSAGVSPIAIPIAGAEMGASMLTGALGSVIGGVAGIGQGFFGGKYGTPEGGREAAQTAGTVAHALTYQPRSALAQEGMATIGSLLDKSKLAGLGPTEAVALNSLPVGQTVRGMGAQVRNAGSMVGDLIQKAEPEMAGGGAAATTAENLRRARAADLPVPIDLTKGQATRDFEQQRFERETSKSASTGDPLRKRYAQQNEDIIKNFDTWIDQTGKEAPTIRVTGQKVADVVARKAEAAKLEINNAYEKARANGAMNEPVPVASLLDYVAAHEPEAINAGVITALGNKIKSLASGGGKDIFGQPKPLQMTVNELEEVRKMVNALSQKDATNAHFGKEIRTMIDDMTENVGGPEYRQARALRTRYGKEFENVGVINKLLTTKPGTTDRSVAYEDVFSHSILKGSLDDVRTVRKTLQTAGPEGEQAWKELQGATLDHLKEVATGNAARDISGNQILSYPKLNAAVRELERDGKLEFIFGKKGAEQIRDITELVADVHTAPPGAINTSNTGAVLLDALGSAATGHIPTATAKVVGVLKEAVGNRAVNRRVREALAPAENPVVSRTIH